MKYAKKMPATDRELSLKLSGAGWKRMKEPSNMITAILISMPFAIVLGGVSVGIAYWLNPSFFEFLKSDSLRIVLNFNGTLLLQIITIFALMVIHELIHAVFIPDFWKSDKTFFGFNGLFGFVFTTESIKKARFMIISVMPFIFLSIVLPIVLSAFHLLNGFTIFLCLVNAAGSCVDFLNFTLILFQVPSGNNIVSNGFETYYR